MKAPKINYDPETGITSYTIYYKDKEFTGIAQCHPDDQDMKSELTGTAIAELRALKLYLRDERDNNLKPQLKSAKQLYYAMNRSKKFNRKSYENIMLQRHIYNLEMDLEAVNEELAVLNQHLTQYIAEKEKVYQHLRKTNQKDTDN